MTSTGQLFPSCGPRSLYESSTPTEHNCWWCGRCYSHDGTFACVSMAGATDGWVDAQVFTDGMPPRSTDPCPDFFPYAIPVDERTDP